MAIVVIVDGIAVCVHISRDLENFQSVVITNQVICNHNTSNFLKSRDSATTKQK